MKLDCGFEKPRHRAIEHGRWAGLQGVLRGCRPITLRDHFNRTCKVIVASIKSCRGKAVDFATSGLLPTIFLAFFQLGSCFQIKEAVGELSPRVVADFAALGL